MPGPKPQVFIHRFFSIFDFLAHCFLIFTLIIVDYEILLYRGEIQPRKARKTGCLEFYVLLCKAIPTGVH